TRSKSSSRSSNSSRRWSVTVVILLFSQVEGPQARSTTQLRLPSDARACFGWRNASGRQELLPFLEVSRDAGQKAGSVPENRRVSPSRGRPLHPRRTFPSEATPEHLHRSQ